MTRIVTYVHRPKRPPRAKAAPITSPAIVTAGSKRRPEPLPGEPTAASAANDGGNSAIVTARKPTSGRFGIAPDLTPEEHQRRGDAADALFGELVRLATDKDRP